MSSVLVAGGAGFLGSHLVDRLLRRQDIERLVVVDNFWTGLKSNLDHISDPRLEIIDIAVENFLSAMRFDEIYHLASPASPPWYMSDPVRTISANVLGGMRLLEHLKEGGRLCFTSTSEVYGDPVVSPQPESYRGSVDCTGPRSSYDESKRCTESLLFEVARVHGVKVRIARLFNVFGPRTRPDDGRAVSNFIARAMRGENIVVYGDGLQTRSWGYVDDIISGLEQYFWLVPHDHCGPLNIGNDREISVLEVARYVASLFPGVSIVHVEAAAQDPTNRRPDLTQARALLPGWQATIPYEDGIRQTISWFQAEESRRADRERTFSPA